MSSRSGYVIGAVGLLLLGAWVCFNYVYLTEVRGRVFIVQRDSHVNRLALLRVVAVGAEEAARWKQTRRADWLFLQRQLADNDRQRSAELSSLEAPHESRRSEISRQIDTATEALELANHAWVVDSKDLESKRRFYLITGTKGFPRSLELEAMVTGSDWFGAAKSLRDTILPELRQQLSLLEVEHGRKVASARRDFDEREHALRRQMDEFFSWTSFSRLPPSLVVAAEDVSDDNGEFRLRLPRGDYVLFAEGRRAVYSKTEHYLWAQPLSVGERVDKFMLSNHNLAWEPGSLWFDLLQGRDWSEAGH
jgi:hypothetical protein